MKWTYQSYYLSHYSVIISEFITFYPLLYLFLYSKMDDSEYESVLLVKREVFVYTLPPRQSARGYRAADWSLDAPAWTGRLKVITRGTKNTLYIRLEDGTSGRLYAQCPVESFPSEAVEQVLDSSRYFVIRLVSDDGRSVLVGIGFAERSDAFDLNVAIQDHFK